MAEPSRVPASHQRLIALLGKQDQPTDALEDYSRLLAGALKDKHRSLELVRVEWAGQGWRSVLKQLAATLAGRQGDWVLVQYTHLAWSRRGFPIEFPRLIRVLIRSGVNVLIMFHDPSPFGGSRLRDRVRRQVQLAVMQRAARLAHRIVSSISPDRVPWMQKSPLRGKILAIPVGSNLPALVRSEAAGSGAPAIVVFGFSELEAETALIASVVLRVAEDYGPLRLLIFGRGADIAGKMLERPLHGSRVHLQMFGILPAAHASSLLANADVQLFVRSGLSTRRGSAIAGIACGLPIVGFRNEETDFPITEAGVRLVPLGDADGLVRELASVLGDPALNASLRERNLQASRRYFSWDRIAEAYLSAIG